LARQRSLEAETARAREAADRAEAERAKMRAELVRQLNVVLATRETARGLIVNMSDVLFDTGLHSLRPGAREKLARISGIILAHPDMRIEVEGHTDSVGGVDLNQRLSEKRADSVRTYLISQGVDSNSIVARGFGKSKPVADNATAAGRQQNRRVELVVNGPLIDKTSSNNGGVSQ
jgi:outer membrane protein OmpA-like peptidoglycan-associated protein